MAVKKPIKRKKKGFGIRGQILIIALGLAGVVFLPTSVLLFAGMIPTFVAIMIDNTPNHSKSITVGSINLAGCSPFVFELWTRGHEFETTFSILADPMAIVVMYAAAGVGYIIDWAVVGLVKNVLVTRAEQRKKTIKKVQKELRDRWGKEVTGEYTLDEHGFAIEHPKPPETPEEKSAVG